MEHHIVCGIQLHLHHSDIIKLSPNGEICYSITSNIETRPRFKGETALGTLLGNYRSTNNEFSRHMRFNNQLRQYFQHLEKALEDADAILVLGPKSLVGRFKNNVADHLHFAPKIILYERAEKLSDAAFMVRLKNFAKVVKNIHQV
jgi:hypothetical protein